MKNSRERTTLWALAIVVVLVVLAVMLLIANLIISINEPFQAGIYKPFSQFIVEYREVNGNQWSDWKNVDLMAEKDCQIKLKTQKAEFRLPETVEGRSLTALNSGSIFIAAFWQGNLRLLRNDKTIVASGQGSFSISVYPQSSKQSIPSCEVELK